MNQYSENYKATIGADFFTKGETINSREVKLQLWDTAGSEKYKSVGQGFYRGSKCCALVFSLSDKKSFEEIEGWRQSFLQQLNPQDSENFPFVLLGNKCDLTDEDVKVTEAEIKKYCEDHNNMKYFPTSAKENMNLNEAFQNLGELALNIYDKTEAEFVPESVPITIIKEKNKGRCCEI